MLDESSVRDLFGFSLFPQASEWPRLAVEALGQAGLEPGPQAKASLLALAAAYGEPPRSYHVFGHALETARISRAMAKALDWKLRPEEASALMAAALCHDVVYVPGGPLNEEASADYGRGFAAGLGLGSEACELASGLILATRHLPEEPSSRLEALIRDADLAILASPPGHYGLYASLIRSEAAAADEIAYREGRSRFLKGFLGRPRLYYLPSWAPLLEEAARRNMGLELSSLEGEAGH